MSTFGSNQAIQRTSVKRETEPAPGSVGFSVCGENGRQGHTTRSVEKPPHYPLTGSTTVRGDTIELRGPGDFYDRKWRRIVYRGIPCLLAEQHYREWKKSGRLDDDRLLFRIPSFDKKHPQLNYGGIEKPDGSITRTSPPLPK
jgi:hypothetical protein